jgi:hypothetical protein
VPVNEKGPEAAWDFRAGVVSRFAYTRRRFPRTPTIIAGRSPAVPAMTIMWAEHGESTATDLGRSVVSTLADSRLEVQSELAEMVTGARVWITFSCH